MDTLEIAIYRLGQCAHCTSTNVRHLCGGCLLTTYCDQHSCQKSHWSQGGHRSECSTLQRMLFLGAGQKRKYEEEEKDPEKRPKTDPVPDLVYDLESLPPVVLQVLTRFLSASDQTKLSYVSRTMLESIRKTVLYTSIFLIRNWNSFFADSNEPKSAWKRQIKKLRLDNDFNQPIDLSNVPNLTDLDLGYDFNQELDLSNVSNLTELHLGYDFNQELDLSNVPNLTKLDLGFWFNQELDLSNVPNLTDLHLGDKFNQALDLRPVPNVKVIFTTPQQRESVIL